MPIVNVIQCLPMFRGLNLRKNEDKRENGRVRRLSRWI